MSAFWVILGLILAALLVWLAKAITEYSNQSASYVPLRPRPIPIRQFDVGVKTIKTKAISHHIWDDAR